MVGFVGLSSLDVLQSYSSVTRLTLQASNHSPGSHRNVLRHLALTIREFDSHLQSVLGSRTHKARADASSVLQVHSQKPGKLSKDVSEAFTACLRRSIFLQSLELHLHSSSSSASHVKLISRLESGLSKLYRVTLDPTKEALRRRQFGATITNSATLRSVVSWLS